MAINMNLESLGAQSRSEGWESLKDKIGIPFTHIMPTAFHQKSKQATQSRQWTADAHARVNRVAALTMQN